MKFFKITEARIDDEKDKYFITSEDGEKELQLNKGFSIAKDILDSIYNNFFGDAVIHIQYTNEVLGYYIGIDDEYPVVDYKNLGVNGCNIEILEEEIECFEEETEYFLDKAHKTLKVRGGVHPAALADRDSNFLDELIKTIHNQDFQISVTLKRAKRSDIKHYMDDIAKKVRDLSISYQKNISEIPNILKNLMNSVTGGEGQGHSMLNISEGLELDLLKDEYNCLSTQNSIFKAPVIEISAGNTNTVNTIKSQLTSFSKRSGVKTNFGVDIDTEARYCPSSFIAAMLALPTTGIPGILVNQGAEYGSDITYTGSENSNITLGKLYKNYQTDIDIKFDINDLRMHAFVTGVTGSGKTSTIKKLLWEANTAGIPFLVLEPAKSEYRNLRRSIDALKRYTLGIEGENSFKLNPFHFPEGIHIQTHLDNLKSVFIAAFPMYGPMPYILETALYKIYKRAGWELISGTNIYANNNIERHMLFPTLEDLYLAIDEVTESIGYSDELKSDVKGALRVRIGSLMTGAKGLMLNTHESNSISELVSCPAVMELENIGDPQEKVFLMGLILISIYEYYISLGENADSIKNILVIEEAHRLLENSPTTNNNEIADMKGKALETFNNILSEIRAYGQGIIIADQIPTDISPNVIKNTNLKIVHRLFAKDDRDMIGNSIGLEDEQIKGLINLKQGEAVVFHSRLNDPLKAKILVDGKIIDNTYIGERIKPESIQLTHLVMLNESFVEAAKKMINLYVLFPRSQNIVINDFKELLEEYYPRNILILNDINLTDNEVMDTFRELLVHYVKQVRLMGKSLISYLDELNVISKIRADKAPLDPLLEFMKKLASKNQHKMGVYCDCFGTYAVLTGKRLPRQVIEQLAIKHNTEFTEGDLSLANRVLKLADLNSVLDTDKLSTGQRIRLCSAVLLASLDADDVILEHYFGIQDGSPDWDSYIEFIPNRSRGAEPKPNEKMQHTEIDTNRIDKSLLSIADRMDSIVDALKPRGDQQPKQSPNSILLYILAASNLLLLIYLLLTNI